jgi:hypothetical protein
MNPMTADAHGDFLLARLNIAFEVLSMRKVLQ